VLPKPREPYEERARKQTQHYAPPALPAPRPKPFGRARRGGAVGPSREADELEGPDLADDGTFDYDNIARIYLNRTGDDVVGYKMIWRVGR